jgi:hypothetical protein
VYLIPSSLELRKDPGVPKLPDLKTKVKAKEQLKVQAFSLKFESKAHNFDRTSLLLSIKQMRIKTKKWLPNLRCLLWLNWLLQLKLVPSTFLRLQTLNHLPTVMWNNVRISGLLYEHCAKLLTSLILLFLFSMVGILTVVEVAL